MQRCDWCQQEESGFLVPVANRNPNLQTEHEYVCDTCADLERSEHVYELFWSPVTFESLTNGRVQTHRAA
jgi:protein-arginine kinase activator protein McsA